MKQIVCLVSRSDGFSTDQCGRTMTVGELIAYLEDFPEDAEVYLKNDNGYAYGRITMGSFEEDEIESEDEEDDEESEYGEEEEDDE